MTLLCPLRTPLDASGLSLKSTSRQPSSSPRIAGPSTRQEDTVPPDSSHSKTFTSDEMADIFDRIAPYLPAHLETLGANPSGCLTYTFKPFTGTSKMPKLPQEFRDDPRLEYVRESEDAAEYRLRECAEFILYEVYEKACGLWTDAAYVAALRAVIKDAPQRWAAYERESRALEAAYSHLRTPQAAAEWLAAISRLVDAQVRLSAAAEAFDDRASEIADVHDKHSGSDLGRDEALTRAGHPEAHSWCIADAEDYRGTYWGSPQYAPLVVQTQALIEAQDAHVSKVGRLAGTSAH
ncbi:hypothetical protein [Streptomyces sp. NPDC088785]|uniref:hypothetical protein n=1 Tax=Streptomyces sp. NPDC088785 TaxID=3365897 RepID=UPI0037FD0613